MRSPALSRSEYGQPRPRPGEGGALGPVRFPKCGCEHFHVIYTRRVWGGTLMRSRECRHCGRRVITYEHVAF
jgi:hypothetical protein